MRLAPNGDVYVIEANPNPWLASRQEFAMAARARAFVHGNDRGDCRSGDEPVLNANLLAKAAGMH